MTTSRDYFISSFSGRVNRQLSLLLAGAALVSSFFLFTRHNDFPFTYHPDERTKAEQVFRKERDFHHPLLMLMVTDRAVKIAEESPIDYDRNLQTITEFGRHVSAFFAAAGAGLLALTAGLLVGWPAALAVGALLAINHDLLRFAHYFKEDTALVFGFAVCVLAIALFAKFPARRTIIFAGIAAALCASSKYIGLIALPLALGCILFHLRGIRKNDPQSRLPRLGHATGWLLLGFIFTVLIVNWRFFLEGQQFITGFSREWSGVTEGHSGLDQADSSRFTTFYLALLREYTPWPMWVLLGLYVIGPFIPQSSRPQWRLEQTFVLALGFIYLALISATSKVSDRYLLPVLALMFYAGGTGGVQFIIAALTSAWKPRWARSLAAVAALGCLVLLWLASFQWFQKVNDGFRQTSVEDLEHYILQNIPHDAIIAQPRRYLVDPDQEIMEDLYVRLPNRIITGERVIEAGLDGLRAQGADYLLVSQFSYERYLHFATEDLVGEKDALSRFEQHRRFYLRLHDEAHVVWTRDAQMPFVLHPGLELWDIRPPQPQPQPSP